MKPGKLFLIPNFIGDTSFSYHFPNYNVEVVKTLKFFFVENPKPARALIKALNKDVNFDEIELYQFDKHTKDNSDIYSIVIKCLLNGNDVGVLSDAGCPGIADPGSDLVQKVHEKDIIVVPLIGPSSIFLTLMASGLNGQHFQFMGYLAKDAKARVDQIKLMNSKINNERITYLFIETPYKSDATFKDILNNLSGKNRLCLGIDLFSQTQYVVTKTIDGWKAMKSLPILKDRQVVFAIG